MCFLASNCFTSLPLLILSHPIFSCQPLLFYPRHTLHPVIFSFDHPPSFLTFFCSRPQWFPLSGSLRAFSLLTCLPHPLLPPPWLQLEAPSTPEVSGVWVVCVGVCGVNGLQDPLGGISNVLTESRVMTKTPSLSLTLRERQARWTQLNKVCPTNSAQNKSRPSPKVRGHDGE